MAVRDFEAFLRERAGIFDPNLDTNPGSPFDVQVIQPMIRRIGPDPFSVDMETFIDARLRQAYPDMALGDGDAITDLLVKPGSLLWDPIVREVARVRRGLSFQDPSTLTEDESDALGANVFSNRAQGDQSRGSVRIFFAQAQNVTVAPLNFVTSKAGLHYFPTQSQTIRVEEMLLNIDSTGLFYFDINVIAEQAGSEYDIAPNEIVSIANLESAVRVTNLRKFEGGDDADTPEEFADRARQELTERSLVTIRGIAAQLTASFPEISRLNVVGFNDPEMNRDVVKGGGLGSVLSAGVAGTSVSDGKNAALTSRFRVLDAGINFINLVGPTAVVPSGYVLSVFEAFGGDVVRDLQISRVVAADELELSTSELIYGLSGLRWTLRRFEITISDIPGGILFPNNAQGELTIRNDEVHIGGALDTHVRGSSFDEATLTIDNLTDDTPEVAGVDGDFTDTDEITLLDLVIGTNYSENDSTYELLDRAGSDALTIQIVDGVNAGVYRILSVSQSGVSPVVTVTPSFVSSAAANARWRLFDEINVSLSDVKETRLTGTDLITTQNYDIVTTAGAIDFDALGVSEGDILRITEGPDAGDHTVAEAPLSPGFTSLRLASPLTSTQSSIDFVIFRANADGNMEMPLVRIKSIELLDSSSQPVGTTIPYAKPVDVQSNAFQNAARGIKHTLTDIRLGLLSQPEPGGGFLIGGQTVTILVNGGSHPITFSGAAFSALSLATVVSELNAGIQLATGEISAVVTVGTRFGIRPFGDGDVLFVTGSSTAAINLFGDTGTRSTSDIRSDTVDALSTSTTSGWRLLDPSVNYADGLDVIQIVDGNQVGIYPGPYLVENPGTNGQTRISIRAGGVFFSPEVGVKAEIGTRSIGSARVFFLEPTSFEARAEETFFSLETDSGVIRFTPDPTLDYQIIPAQPNGVKPLDGSASDLSITFTSASQDFLLSNVKAGDTLVVDYHPIAGTVVLTDPVVGLVNQTFVFSINGSPNKTLVFIRDDISLGVTEVSREGVVEQINAAAGIDIVSLTSSNTLEFEVDAALTIRSSGTANATILGTLSGPGTSFSTQDITNESPIAGTFTVGSVDSQTTLRISGALFNDSGSLFEGLGPFTRQQFKISKAGVQRISTTAMASNEGEVGLYYFDVELVSEGSGDVYNIGADNQLIASGFRSDGYYLTTEDTNLSFSTLERPVLVLSKSILEDGVDDDPANATQLAGQNIQITYDRSTLVEDTQSFVGAETERVVCSNPLARHLIPNFFRTDITYAGGSREDIVIPDVEDYVTGLSPVESLESSDIQAILTGRGATSITNPIDLIAVVHNLDRTITLARSQNALTTSRLSAFIPDRLNIVRSIL